MPYEYSAYAVCLVCRDIIDCVCHGIAHHVMMTDSRARSHNIECHIIHDGFAGIPRCAFLYLGVGCMDALGHARVALEHT